MLGGACEGLASPVINITMTRPVRYRCNRSTVTE